jgi:hypothetical protein
MLSVLKSVEEVEKRLGTVLENFKSTMVLQECYTEPVHTFHIVLAASNGAEEGDMISRLESILKEKIAELKCLGVRLVNVLVPQPPKV